MFKSIVPTTTVGMAIGVACMGAIAPLSAQAATLDYTSNLIVQATGNPIPLISSTSSYTKTDLASGSVGYKLLSFSATLTTPFLTRTFTQADLPTYAALAGQFSALLPTQYQSEFQKYQGILANLLTNTPYTYVGDGGFPPADFTYSFSGSAVPNVSVLPRLFPNGGTISYNSTFLPLPVIDPGPGTDPHTAATPEPTTMLGIALAGAGLAAVRRRRARKGTEC